MRRTIMVLALLVLSVCSNAKKITIVVEVPDETVSIGKKADEFPLIFNEQVEKCLMYCVTTDREYFAKKLWESGKYLDTMKKIFQEKGLPPELVYLGLVESGFNPYAYSRGHAVGVWQFMKSTGKLYGLEQNNWADDRRNVEKSTLAAAKILKSLYNEFGSWELAIAAYNCGNSRVYEAMKNHGTRDFWALLLPAETMAFVAKVIAVIMIAKDPQAYGFSGELAPSSMFDVVRTMGCIDLNIVAKCCEVPLEEITILNPELTNRCTPQEGEYDLKIPEGTKEKFLQNFAGLPDKGKYLSREEISRRKGGWVVYTVKKGDNLGGIAKKFRVSVENIKKWNPCARRKFIYPGDRLRILRG